HLKEGGQNYDVMGWNQEQLINDILDQYEKHLHFLHRALKSDAVPGRHFLPAFLTTALMMLVGWRTTSDNAYREKWIWGNLSENQDVFRRKYWSG
ncbi:hypothetical protein J4732_16765, partial [Serratia marcescens]|nr:hypothetical protein [Serratia marcescens]